MSDLDLQLRALIEAVCRWSPGTSERRIALNHLLRSLQRLPGLLKSSHPDYLEALNMTWRWVCQNIDRFDATDPDVAKNLRTWINSYLVWRIRDLRIPDEKYISLDQPRFAEGDSLVDQLPDPESERGNCFLDSLDRWIEVWQAEDRQRLGQDLLNYIAEDPQARLRGCRLRKQPQIDAQLLVQRLCLKDPPDTIAKLSEEFGIHYQTLNSHWQRRCKPLLQDLIAEFQNQP